MLETLAAHVAKAGPCRPELFNGRAKYPDLAMSAICMSIALLFAGFSACIASIEFS